MLPQSIYVIPNAIVADQFKPAPIKVPTDFGEVFPLNVTILRPTNRLFSDDCCRLAFGLPQGN